MANDTQVTPILGGGVVNDKAGEEPNGLSDEMLVYKCKILEGNSREARRKHDWEWVVRQLYVRGYHFARYNRSSGTVVFSTRTGVHISINLVTAHLRGVRNQVTSFQPKWEVLPKVTTDDAFENARFSGKVLDYIYDRSQIKRKIKEVVNDALIYSIGIWHFDTDRDGNIVIDRIDPFDFYIDPNVKSPNLNDPEYGAEYVILAHQVPLDQVQKNKEYQYTDGLQADNLTASAEYKRFLQQVTKYQYSAYKAYNKTIILKQAWMRERQSDGTIKMRVVDYVDSIAHPLKNILVDDPNYPFEILQGDIQGGELYGEAWVKHLIPINRIIDALESHIFEYNHMYARGRYVIDKNSGVRLIVNQHGQIIEKNRGSQITPLPIAPLPPTPESQIARMKVHLEDISGVHDVSLGRMPATIRSGVAVAELRQSDATNQADLVDNMEDFLSRSGQKILKLVSENWNTTKLIAVTGVGGKPEYFMAVGTNNSLKGKKQFKFGDRNLKLAVIGGDNEVRVQVGSWLAYTKEARQEKLKDLFRLGAIDQQTYLQHAEFADIDGILERSREERILQQNAGSKSESVAKDFGIQLDDESLALAENELMDQGIEQHAEPGDDHQVHLIVHREDADNEMVQKHMKEHIQFQKWEQKMGTRPLQQAGQPGTTPGMPPPPGTGNGAAGPLPQGGQPLPGGPSQGGQQFPPFLMGPRIGPGTRPLQPDQGLPI